MPEISINVPAGGASVTAAFAGGRQIPIFTNVGLTTQAPLPIALSATSRTTLYIGAVGSYDIVVTDASGRVLEVAAGIAMSVEPLVFVPAGSVSVADGSATYGPPKQRAIAVLEAVRSGLSRSSRLASAYPVTADAPTVAHSTSFTVTTQFTAVEGRELKDGLSSRISLLGAKTGTWNGTLSYLQADTNGSDTTPNGYGFTLTGTRFDYQWRAGAGTELMWIFVDGVPTTAAPFSPLAVSAGTNYNTLVTFSTSGTRRIEIWHTFGQFVALRTANATGTVAALTKGPRLWCFGDSYTGGSSLIPALQTWARRIGFACAVDLYQAGQGGTGYTVAGSLKELTHSSRLAPCAAADPDVIVIWAGGNDTGSAEATTQAAATTVLSYLATNAPNSRVVLVGPFPSNSGATLAASRATTGRAIRTAGSLAPNCIGYIDCIGTSGGSVPAAMANGTAYAIGDRFTFGGAVYEVVNGYTASSSLNAGNTRCLTWLTGTGNASTPANDGNRDLLLGGDGTHWTLDGAGVQAALVLQGLEKVLASYVSGATYTVVND